LDHIKNKIIIGSAQFGSNYGEFNTNGPVLLKEARSIINFALENGCKIIDTASDYYKSEEIIGKIGVKGLKIITKIRLPKKETTSKENYLETSINKTLKITKTPKLDCLLFRNPTDLIDKSNYSIWITAQGLKKNKLIDKIGITIYSPKELDIVLEKITPDVVQIPFNIFDHRIRKSGWLDELYKNKIEIHARSVFLQGLLLQESEDLGHKFKKYNVIWKKYRKWLHKNNINSLDLCISHVRLEEKISKFLIGVENKKQLIQIINSRLITKKLPEWMSELSENLVSPNLWKS